MPSFCRAAIDNIAVIFLWRLLVFNLSCALRLAGDVNLWLTPTITSKEIAFVSQA